MTIGKLAKSSGIGIETIRFYEREGLIAQPKLQKDSSFRKYDKAVLHRIAFIRQAKGLGFSLTEIRELLSLKAQPNANCSRVKAKAEKKIDEIEKKIADLSAIKKALKILAANCHSDHLASECNILAAMEPKGKDL